MLDHINNIHEEDIVKVVFYQVNFASHWPHSAIATLLPSYEQRTRGDRALISIEGAICEVSKIEQVVEQRFRGIFGANDLYNRGSLVLGAKALSTVA